MNRIDDPQLRFYLDRKTLIDQWAGLRQAESRALDQLVTSLRPELDLMADELGAVPHLRHTRTSTVLGLHAPEWQVDDERPAVVLGIGCHPASGSFTDRDKTPWVGARVRRSSEQGVVTASVAEALHGSRQTSGFPRSDGRTSNWVAYRWEAKAPEIGWDDLEPYRHRLLASLRECWNAMAPLVIESLDVQALRAAAARG